jgi:hypothetical protein
MARAGPARLGVGCGSSAAVSCPKTVPAILNGPAAPCPHAGARAASRRPGIARPRGGPGAPLDTTRLNLAKLCPRAAVW